VASLGLHGCGGGPDIEDPLKAPERLLVEVFRLGGVEPIEAEMFSVAPRLVVDEANHVYVLHSRQGRVAAFGEDGEFLNWIGQGAGRGPGEFNSPRQLGLLGDTVWIRNGNPDHITLFLNDGTLIRTDLVSLGASPGRTSLTQGISGYLKDGRSWVEPDRPPTALEEGKILSSPLEVGVRRVDGKRDTILTYRSKRGRLRGLHFDPIPEPPFFSIAADGSGIAIAEWSAAQPDRLGLRVLYPDGRLLWEEEFTVPRQAIARAELEAIIEEGRELVGRQREDLLTMGLTPAGVPQVPTEAEMAELVHLPAYRPPVRAVHLGVDGTAWLSLAEPQAGEEWVALGRNEGILFRIRVPKGATLGQATREAVWYSEADEVGVTWIVRGQIMDNAETTKRSERP
jgi:hypothetical protein